MATNAGEVRITLSANAAEFRAVLEESIQLIRQLKVEVRQLNALLGRRRVATPIDPEVTQTTQRSLNQLNRSVAQFGRTAQDAGQRTSRSINEANRSVTLLVAKFALMTFAVQTVANIINSTFGAALRNIDEFQQGVISTAAAITNIADLSEGGTFTEAFAQNISFVRDTFQELELIAGNFFSTANDLQLAFNTLAARGVIIRREELQLLGLITDQILLQTRGQVTSIQVAQELRNLFTGQVRAADQLAQLIRAQGGDVEEISQQLRETGSLQPLEPFVRGLREALGLIQGLLVPQLARFQAIVQRISRLALGSVFEGTVDSVRRLNDFLTRSTESVAIIARLVVERVAIGFRNLLNAVQPFAAIITDIAFSGIPAIAVVIGLVLRRFGLLPAIAGTLVATFIDLNTETDGLSKTFRILGNILRGTILSTFIAIRDVVRLLLNPTKAFEFILNGIAVQFGGLVLLLAEVGRLTGKLSIEEYNRGVLQANTLIEELQRKNRELLASLETGFDNLSLDKALDRSLASTEDALAKLEKVLNIDTADIPKIAEILGITPEELARITREIREALQRGASRPFPTITPFTISDREFAAQKRESDALFRLNEEAIRRRLQIEKNGINEQNRLLAQQVAQREITEAQAFQRRRDLRVAELQAEADAIDSQIANQERQFAREKQLLDARADSAEKTASLRELEANRIIALSRLERRRTELNQQLNSSISESNIELAESQRRIREIIQDLSTETDTFFATTVSDKIAELDRRVARLIDRLRGSEAGLSPQDEAIIRQQVERQKTFIQLEPFLRPAIDAIDQSFNTLTQAIVRGGVNFKQFTQQVATSFIRKGLQDLQKQLVEGFVRLFEGLGDIISTQAAAALSVGIGIILSLFSRAGNEGSFTPGGGGVGTGSLVDATQQVRGVIGGATSIPLAELNLGLQEALIPTNNILATIERNTRSLAELNLNLNPDQLSESIQNKIQDILNQALLQVP